MFPQFVRLCNISRDPTSRPDPDYGTSVTNNLLRITQRTTHSPAAYQGSADDTYDNNHARWK